MFIPLFLQRKNNLGGEKARYNSRKPKHVNCTFLTSSTKVMKEHPSSKPRQPWTWSRDFRCASFISLSYFSFFFGRSTADTFALAATSVGWFPLFGRECRAALKIVCGPFSSWLVCMLARNAPYERVKITGGGRMDGCGQVEIYLCEAQSSSCTGEKK